MGVLVLGVGIRQGMEARGDLRGWRVRVRSGNWVRSKVGAMEVVGVRKQW